MLIPMQRSLDMANNSYNHIISVVKRSAHLSFLPKLILLSCEKLITSPQDTFQRLYKLSGPDKEIAKDLSMKSSTAVCLNNDLYLNESNIILNLFCRLLYRNKYKGNNLYQNSSRRDCP